MTGVATLGRATARIVCRETLNILRMNFMGHIAGVLIPTSFQRSCESLVKDK